MYTSAVVLLSCLSYQSIHLPRSVEPRISQLAERLDARDRQVERLLKHAEDVMEDNYWTTKANIETTAVILRDVAEITGSVRREIPELIGAVKELKALSSSVREDVSLLADGGAKALVATAGLAEELESLTEELSVQIRTGSPKVFQTIERVDQLVLDIDKHVSNPDVYALVNNAKEISGSAAEIAKTTDVVTRPLREKAKLIKTILLRIAGMIRIQPF